MNTDVEETKVGDTVVWRDGDGERHKVTARSPDGRLFQAEGAPGLATADGAFRFLEASPFDDREGKAVFSGVETVTVMSFGSSQFQILREAFTQNGRSFENQPFTGSDHTIDNRGFE